MTRTSALFALLLVPAAASASDGGATPGALDLSVPQAPMRYLDDPAYRNEAPGTFHGDHSGRRLSGGSDSRPATGDRLQVQGMVSAGIGHSSAYGNHNWQAVDLNLGKNYTTDDGRTRRVDLNIHLSKDDGIGPYGPGPGPWYGGW